MGWDWGKNSAVIPAVLLAGINAYNLWNEHWEHWSHLPPLEERTEYPYQNIRTKNYFWGDGDKVFLPSFLPSFFLRMVDESLTFLRLSCRFLLLFPR